MRARRIKKKKLSVPARVHFFFFVAVRVQQWKAIICALRGNPRSPIFARINRRGKDYLWSAEAQREGGTRNQRPGSKENSGDSRLIHRKFLEISKIFFQSGKRSRLECPSFSFGIFFKNFAFLQREMQQLGIIDFRSLKTVCLFSNINIFYFLKWYLEIVRIIKMSNFQF